MRLVPIAFLTASTACSVSGGTGSAIESRVPEPQGSAGSGGSGGTAGGPGPIATDGGVDPGHGCSSSPTLDTDGDGFAAGDGDCNDCDANVNPGAYDFAANAIDEDCSGTVDDELIACDGALALEGDDPADAARAIGLCRDAVDRSWGLVSARWTFPDGTETSGYNDNLSCDPPSAAPPHAMQRGILPSFGPNVLPRTGQSMLALSTGAARAGVVDVEPPNGDGRSPNGARFCRASYAPPGFPKDFAGCDTETADDHDAQDPIALELEIRVPTNARGLSFDFDFYTFEWPEYVCDFYNDFFVALLESTAPGTPADRNVSFDSQGNPVSVNNGLVEVCKGPTSAGQKQFPCTKGAAELTGTGFEEHAATGWLTTTAPVVPGETVRVRFAIWDMGDEILDSTVLVDALRWDVVAGSKPDTTPSVPR